MWSLSWHELSGHCIFRGEYYNPPAMEKNRYCTWFLQRYPLTRSDKRSLKDDYSFIMIKLMLVQKCVLISNRMDHLRPIWNWFSHKKFSETSLKNVMIVSSPEFYIVLSSKIFKAEIKEFEAILCWPEHVIKCHGLGHAQVNKLDKSNAVNDPNSFLFLHVSTKMFVYTW